MCTQHNVNSEWQFPQPYASLLINVLYEEWLPSYTYSPKCIGYQGMSEGKTKWVTILEFQTAVSLSTLSLRLSLSLLSISFYNTLFFTYSITPLFNGFRRVRITSGKRASFEFSNKTQLRHRYTTWKPHADTCLNERWSKWKRRRMGRIATVIHRRRNHRLTPRHFQKREGGRE